MEFFIKKVANGILIAISIKITAVSVFIKSRLLTSLYRPRTAIWYGNIIPERITRKIIFVILLFSLRFKTYPHMVLLITMPNTAHTVIIRVFPNALGYCIFSNALIYGVISQEDGSAIGFAAASVPDLNVVTSR